MRRHESTPATRVAARGASGWLVLGQGLFALMMLSCVAIEPSWLAVKRGLSYYGNEAATIVPYTFGFVFAIALGAVGLARLRAGARGSDRLRAAVGALLALMIPIPLTPYSVDIAVDWLHICATTVLFLAGLVLGAWLVFTYVRDRRGAVLFVLQAAAAASILTAQVGLQNSMIPSQLVFQLLAVTLVVLALRRAGGRRGDPPRPLVWRSA
jgi:hypothetical protein